MPTRHNAKKPAKIMMHNTSQMYAIYPIKVEEQDVLETFFLNTLWKDHKMNKGSKGSSSETSGTSETSETTETPETSETPET